MDQALNAEPARIRDQRAGLFLGFGRLTRAPFVKRSAIP